jgi:hypothetical protein
MSRLSHDWVNSFASAFAVLVALLSLGLTLYDRAQAAEEYLVVQPAVLAGGEDLRIGVINAGKREVWLRYLAVRFFDNADNEIGDQITVKPPPHEAILLAPTEVKLFYGAYSKAKIPDDAVYVEIAIGTTLSDIPCLLVKADFFRAIPEEYGLVSKFEGAIWRIPRRDQVVLGEEIAAADRSPAWGFPLR